MPFSVPLCSCESGLSCFTAVLLTHTDVARFRPPVLFLTSQFRYNLSLCLVTTLFLFEG